MEIKGVRNDSMRFNFLPSRFFYFSFHLRKKYVMFSSDQKKADKSKPTISSNIRTGNISTRACDFSLAHCNVGLTEEASGRDGVTKINLFVSAMNHRVASRRLHFHPGIRREERRFSIRLFPFHRPTSRNGYTFADFLFPVSPRAREDDPLELQIK